MNLTPFASFASFASSVKRIAALFGLSQKTVFFHRGRVLRKLGLENAVQLVLWARERGIV